MRTLREQYWPIHKRSSAKVFCNLTPRQQQSAVVVVLFREVVFEPTWGESQIRRMDWKRPYLRGRLPAADILAEIEPCEGLSKVETVADALRDQPSRLRLEVLAPWDLPAPWPAEYTEKSERLDRRLFTEAEILIAEKGW